jgi:hypothetical protein
MSLMSNEPGVRAAKGEQKKIQEEGGVVEVIN